MVSNFSVVSPEELSGKLTHLLLGWYEQSARQLPWRDRPEPYRVWVSEIMLQQTRVETVRPYFERWMSRFPTVGELASASEQDVLQTWEGLGYYSRARNLHKAARMVMDYYGGKIPAERIELETLPGIGRYTAGAIASIAFGKDEPALDGNIRRVLARIYNVTELAQSTKGERLLWDLARRSLPSGRAGDFNQALMDLGASICTPQSPVCRVCPVAACCQAFMAGVQESRPVLQARKATPRYTVTAAVISREDLVLIAQRPSNGLLGGMWEFPGGKVEDGEELADALKREIYEELGALVLVGELIGVFKHAYTHFKITLYAYYCSLVKDEPAALEASEIRWVKMPDLGQYPMGKIDRMISCRLEETCFK